MNCYGGGLITILLYGVGIVDVESGAILTESSIDVLTEASQTLLTETV